MGALKASIKSKKSRWTCCTRRSGALEGTDGFAVGFREKPRKAQFNAQNHILGSWRAPPAPCTRLRSTVGIQFKISSWKAAPCTAQRCIDRPTLSKACGWSLALWDAGLPEHTSGTRRAKWREGSSLAAAESLSRSSGNSCPRVRKLGCA